MTDENDKISKDQYGRKKWNVELYEQEAKEKLSKPRDSINSKYLLKNDESNDFIKHRNKLLNDSLNKVKNYNIINPEESLSHKKFGFFCPVCDVTFRDNLKLIDHLNSPQHVQKSNQLNKKGKSKENEEMEILDGGIRRASVNEVIQTMERLIAKNLKDQQMTEKNQELSFEQRVERRRQFENEKRLKKLEKKQQNKLKKQKIQNEPSDVDKFMGFSSFGSAKK